MERASMRRNSRNSHQAASIQNHRTNRTSRAPEACPLSSKSPAPAPPGRNTRKRRACLRSDDLRYDGYIIMNCVAQIESLPEQLDALRASLLQALEVGEVEEARQLLGKLLAADPSRVMTEEWAQLSDVTAWPDAWLIAAVRRDP